MLLFKIWDCIVDRKSVLVNSPYFRFSRAQNEINLWKKENYKKLGEELK